MGIMNWLARRGAVGGTARWAADCYLKTLMYGMAGADTANMDTDEGFRAENRKILHFIVSARYRLPPDKPLERAVLREMEQTDGLLGLVLSILKVEARLHENSQSAIKEMMDVILDELHKKKIGRRAIQGADRTEYAAFLAFATTPPGRTPPAQHRVTERDGYRLIDEVDFNTATLTGRKIWHNPDTEEYRGYDEKTGGFREPTPSPAKTAAPSPAKPDVQEKPDTGGGASQATTQSPKSPPSFNREMSMEQMSHHQMLCLARQYEYWALCTPLETSRRIQLLQWVEQLENLAEEVGEDWNPPEPSTINIIGFMARKAEDFYDAEYAEEEDEEYEDDEEGDEDEEEPVDHPHLPPSHRG